MLAYPLLGNADVTRETTPSPERKQSVARNPKATHDYHILDTFETGIVLTGGSFQVQASCPAARLPRCPSQYLGIPGSTRWAQASIPPARLRTFPKPAPFRISSAFIEREPLWQ